MVKKKISDLHYSIGTLVRYRYRYEAVTMVPEHCSVDIASCAAQTLIWYGTGIDRIFSF